MMNHNDANKVRNAKLIQKKKSLKIIEFPLSVSIVNKIGFRIPTTNE